jgi:hypothetical protein
MAFMQEPPRDRLAQAEFAALSEFDHASDGLPPVFPIKPVVLRKARKRSIEHFLYRAVEAAGQLLLYNLLLLWFEFDRHNFTVSSSTASCKRGLSPHPEVPDRRGDSAEALASALVNTADDLLRF